MIEIVRESLEPEPTAGDIIALGAGSGRDLPWPDMSIDLTRTALVLVDPQKGFLDPDGSLWPAVAGAVRTNNVVEHLEWLLETARMTGMLRVICPHHHDQDRETGIGVGRVVEWARNHHGNAGTLKGRDEDLLPSLLPYLEDEGAIITGSHRLCGLANRELMQELRARRIEHVILAGMCANLCLEGHLRELVENGFEVAVVRDATAGTCIAGVDGHQTAMHSFRLLANAIWDTRETILRMYGKNV